MLAEWGHNGHGPGSFVTVTGIAVAPDGSLYTTDGSGRVQKFTADGDYLMAWGPRGDCDGNANGKLDMPIGLAIAPSGVIYVVDHGACNVQAFDAQGHFLFKWGTRGSGPGQLGGPEGIALDRGGNVWITDQDNHRVEEFSADGRFVRQWSHEDNRGGDFSPLGVAAGPDDRIFVTEFNRNGVEVFSQDGHFLDRWGEATGSGLPPTQLQQPRPDVGADSALRPSVHFARPFPHLSLRRAEQLCGAGARHPSGIAVDSIRSVYVADGEWRRIQRYSPSGRYLGGWWIDGVPHWFSQEEVALAVDRSGNTFASVWSSDKVRKIGYGLTPFERILTRSAPGADPLAAIDSLLAIPLGRVAPTRMARPPQPIQAKLSSHGTDATASSRSDVTTSRWVGQKQYPAYGGTLQYLWTYVGWNRHPTLESVAWVKQLPRAADSVYLAKVRRGLDGVLDRKLSTTAPAWTRRRGLPSWVHLGQGAILRSSVSSFGHEPFQLRIERVSPGLQLAELNPDTCDLRVLEGALDDQDGLLGVVRQSLRTSGPELAAALVADPDPEESLPAVRQALSSVSAPGVPDSVRDLVRLAADQWVQRLQNRSHPEFLDTLMLALGQFNFGGRHGMYGASWSYCGSMLGPTLAHAGSNPWADRAFLLVLDRGWVTDCDEGIADALFQNDLFAPVIKRGEAFLAGHMDAPVWPSVALRVAMAHETVWSLSKAGEEISDDDEWDVPRHRLRALALYRSLLPRTRDPRLVRALQRRVEALETDTDSGCQTYFRSYE